MKLTTGFTTDHANGFGVAFASFSKIVFQDSELLDHLRLPAEAMASARPSAVFYEAAKQQLFLVKVVPAHDPITLIRRLQLSEWAQGCSATKIFITALPNMATYQAFGKDSA